MKITVQVEVPDEGIWCDTRKCKWRDFSECLLFSSDLAYSDKSDKYFKCRACIDAVKKAKESERVK